MYKKIIPVLACVVAMPLLACAAPAVQPQNATGDSDQQINDFSIAGVGAKGQEAWKLAAKTADIFDDTIKLKDIKGNMYGEKENVNLTADQGDYNKSAGKVHLEQNVVITTSSGAKLTTDSLDWDRQNQRVSTNDKVDITKESMHTTAMGASGQPNLNKMTLEKDVTVRMNPDNEVKAQADSLAMDQVIITCDGPLEIDYQKNIAKFSNNVKADKKDSIIYADVMEIYFLKGNVKSAKTAPADSSSSLMGSKIDKIVCRGNVKIVRGENVSYSEEATYSGTDQKITLTGRPKLVIYTAADMKTAFSK